MAFTYSARQRIFIKEQSGTGVPSTSFAAGDACSITSFRGEMSQNSLASNDKDGTFSPVLGNLDAITVDWEAAMDLRPSGTAGTPPDCNSFLKSAFGTETINAGVSAVYTVDDTSDLYLSILDAEGNTSIDYSQLWDAQCFGVSWQLGEGLATSRFNGGAIGYVSSKRFSSQSSEEKGRVTPLGSMPSIPGSATLNGTPPQARQGSITLDGQTFSAFFRTGSIDFQSGRALDGPGWGSSLARGFVRNRRAVSFSFEVTDTDTSEMTPILQKAHLGTTIAVTVVAGSVAGLRVTWAMPKVRLSSPTKNYSQANRGRTISGLAFPSSTGANDELTVTYS